MNVFPEAEDVLEFWFRDAPGGGKEALSSAFARWFAGGDMLDREIRARFGPMVEAALAGGYAEWEENVRARLALILLLDQFPRNIFRRTARAFAGDERALRLAKRSVASGEDAELAAIERFFLLMPYQHAEDRDTQHDGVRLFEALASAGEPGPLRDLLQSGLGYARRHCDIIERFGRFPYRNDVLERDTSDEEERWLAESGERFGQ